MTCEKCKREIFVNEAMVTMPVGWTEIKPQRYHLSCWQSLRDERGDDYEEERR